MGVYIKGMEMPKNCPCELVGIGYDMYCSFVHGIPARVREYDECCEKETRPDWCPLIELPPHGRLIEAERLKEVFHRNVVSGDAFDQLIDIAPTVIPAELPVLHGSFAATSEQEALKRIAPAEEGE